MRMKSQVTEGEPPGAGFEGGLIGKLHLQPGACVGFLLRYGFGNDSGSVWVGVAVVLPVKCPWNMSCFKKSKKILQRGGFIIR